MEDSILIEALELSSRLGVPASERATPQRLTAHLRLIPARPLRDLADDIAHTVDYAAVCETLRTRASTGERHLLETLAEDLALHLLKHFPLRAVELELRKYVVPGTAFTAVQIRREKEEAESSS